MSREYGTIRPVKVDDVLMEITNRCYVGCRDCYKRAIVFPGGGHVDLETVGGRINWVRRHTTAGGVYLLGGEPLLHPNLPEVVEMIWGLRLNAFLITAGQVSRLPAEQRNYQFLLDQYEKGRLHLELSYQPGRNDDAYRKLYQDLMDRVGARRKRIKAEIKRAERLGGVSASRRITFLRNRLELALFSTVTIPSIFQGQPEKFKEVFRFLLETAGFDFGNVTADDKPIMPQIEEMNRRFERHLLWGSEAEGFRTSISYEDKTDQKTRRDIRARLWGPVRFVVNGEGRVEEVLKSLGTKESDDVCPAMSSWWSQNQLIVSNMTIRSDGELVFSTPACIAAPVGFLNVDMVRSNQEIYERIRANIEAIQMVNIQTMRVRGANPSEYCKKDPDYSSDDPKKVCPSCPFDVSCNACLSRTVEDREGYYEMFREVNKRVE